MCGTYVFILLEYEKSEEVTGELRLYYEEFRERYNVPCEFGHRFLVNALFKRGKLIQR